MCLNCRTTPHTMPATPADTARTAPNTPAAPSHHHAGLPSVLRFGGRELLLDTRTLLVHGEHRPLRRKVFDLILLLIRHRPAAMARDDILDSVWPRGSGSSAALARTVLEARRALGDKPDDPALIVTVHGIGYRFAGVVSDAEPVPDGDPGAPLEEVRQLLRGTQRALDLEQDAAAARRHAERALALAELQGFGAERAKALAWCAWLAMQDGRVDIAARQAATALGIARAEQHQGALALALLSDGFVRCMAGDLASALQALRQAHPLLEGPALAARRYHCESLLGSVHRELDNLDQALDWTAKARDTALAAGLFLHAQRAVVHMLAVKLRCGDALRAQQQEADAVQAWNEGMDLVRLLQRSAVASRDGWIGMGATASLAMLLARLGRASEARQHFTALEHALAQWPGPAGPMWLQHRVTLHCERALMDAACKEHALAWADVQCALELLEQDDIGSLRAAVYRCASTVLERAGRYHDALCWAHQEREATVAMRKGQAAKLAVALHAEAATLRLRQDIDSARQQLGSLAREVQALREQVRTLEPLIPRDPLTGLLPQAHFACSLERLHREARERDLPFCLGLVRVRGMAGLAKTHAPEMLTMVFRRLAERLARSPDVATAMAQWGDDAVIFALQRLGHQAAADVLCTLVHEMERVRWADLAAGLQLELHAGVRNAASHASLAEAAALLCALQPTDQVWPRVEPD